MFIFKFYIINTGNIKASLLYPSQCYLGEGPVWHASRNSCFWVDIENGTLFEYLWQTKSVKFWKFNSKLTFVVPCNNDHELILALDTSIARFNLETEKLARLMDLEEGKEGNRCNDGGCDSLGRLWIGTMSRTFDRESGALYCVDTDMMITKKLDRISISNGLVWSPDNKRVYYVDSPTGIVQAFHFNEATGEIVFEKNAIVVPQGLGSPDGMTIDEQGMLWIAQWGGFGVYKWNPHDGKLLDKIEIPVPQVSSCCFAGEELDHLIITTARENLSEEDLQKFPDSGNVFVAKMTVKGLRQNNCNIAAQAPNTKD